MTGFLSVTEAELELTTQHRLSAHLCSHGLSLLSTDIIAVVHPYTSSYSLKFKLSQIGLPSQLALHSVFPLDAFEIDWCQGLLG